MGENTEYTLWIMMQPILKYLQNWLLSPLPPYATYPFPSLFSQSRLLRWRGTLNKNSQISEWLVFQKVMYDVVIWGTEHYEMAVRFLSRLKLV